MKQRHTFKNTNMLISTHEHKVSNFNPKEQAQSMRHVIEHGTKTVCFYTAAARGQNTKHGVCDSWQVAIRMSDKKRSQHTLPAPKYQALVTLLARLWGHQHSEQNTHS